MLKVNKDVGKVRKFQYSKTGFPKLSVHKYPLDNYRFARVPPKFSHIFSWKAQLALMHNLFSVARQPITFPLNLLNL